MEDLTFYDFDKPEHGNRITGRKIRIHNKKGNRTIIFSSECSQEIAAISTPKMRIAENNLTGEIYIVINSDKGAEIRKNNGNLTVYRKNATDLLVSKLGLTDETSDIILSSNKANTHNTITYKIILP